MLCTDSLEENEANDATFENGNSRQFNKPIATMSDSLNADGKLITKHWCPSSKEISHAIDTISKPIPVHFRVGKFDDHEDEIIIQDVELAIRKVKLGKPGGADGFYCRVLQIWGDHPERHVN